MYKEYQIHPLLSPYVETYWMLNGFIEGELRHRVLPDGCVDILIPLGRGAGDTRMKPFLPYVVGTMTTFFEVVYRGEMKILGIRFKPGAITAFTRVPVYSFTDTTVDMQSCETIFDRSFYEILEEKTEVMDILSHVDTYLISRLPSLFLLDNRIQYAVSLVEQSKGTLPIALLAEKSCLSKRQFERRFINDVGISPKTFSRVIKFSNACCFLNEEPKKSLFETAIDCGYYDHAHLIKEFKSLSGLSPAEF